ncbi:hypothetical protein EXIGLDRAFT_841237 [Exidia glandulosa HHB12029]|uniref:F-box domain-containing protein n=1 Tax=Exidia glandulosa HHB12029 TaxID=1314781 RepID=A0A165E043_EXIGL|nr:hypothetical protein EXIGLDRAFT_841237 [Exidia glandulosa HHB12029]
MLKRISRRLRSVFSHQRNNNDSVVAQDLSSDLTIGDARAASLPSADETPLQSTDFSIAGTSQEAGPVLVSETAVIPASPPGRDSPVGVDKSDSRVTEPALSDGSATSDGTRHLSSPALHHSAQSVVLVDDILDIIFKQLTACKHMETYDLDYAATPFRLAAVCKQWRDVALGPLLWTHLYLPCGPEHRDINYNLYVQRVLERSQDMALHILLFDCDKDSLATDALALHAVIAMSTRWRAITMTGKPLEWAQWRAILHCDTPLLEYAYVFGDEPRQDEEREPAWRPADEDLELLPNAPKLQSFEVSWVPILCAPLADWEVTTGTRWYGPGPTPLASLTCLRLFLLQAEAERLHDLLRSLPNLTELCLAILKLSINIAQFALSTIRGGGGPYALPELRYLDLRGVAPLIFIPTSRRIETPVLETVTLQPDNILPLTYFFRTLSNAENVRSLTIIGGVAKVAASDLLMLSMLRNIESVVLDCEIADSIFEGMSVNAESLWPKMHTLHIDKALESDAVRQSLLQFIKAKNATSATAEGVSAFQHVCVNEEGWLPKELEALLGEDSRREEAPVLYD